jgi:SAM-dependent methyltransferase
MNWTYLRHVPWLDSQARFVATTPRGGNLLDLGSSDGLTLGHMAELRPDLKFHAVDIAGHPENYPKGCQFHRADLERDRLPWTDASMDAVTCIHLVEHLTDLTLLLQEVVRLLKPGGRVYFETPHPKSLVCSSARGRAALGCTVNFYDDPQHTRPVTLGSLTKQVCGLGLDLVSTGTARNWLYSAAYVVYGFLPPSRKKYIAYLHWTGWQVYLVSSKPVTRPAWNPER